MKRCCWHAGLLIAVLALHSSARTGSCSVDDSSAEGSCGGSYAGVDDDVTLLQVMTERKSRSDLRIKKQPDVEVAHAGEKQRGQQKSLKNVAAPAKESLKSELVQQVAQHATDLSGESQQDTAGRQTSRTVPGSRQARQNERRRKRKTRPLSPPPWNWVPDWSTDPKLQDYTAMLGHPFHTSFNSQRGAGQEQSMLQILLCCCATIGMCAVSWIAYSSLGRADMSVLKLILLCFSFGACSWGMTIVNKSLVLMTNTPTIVAAAQMSMTVIGLYLFARDRLVGSQEAVLKWLSVPLLSAIVLVASFFTYRYVSLSTLIIVRNLGSLIMVPVESVVMPVGSRSHVSGQMMLALLVCLGSAVFYCKTIRVSMEGFGFALVNMVLIMAECLVQRRLLTNECKALSIESCVYINNFLGIVPALILGAFLGEFSKVDTKVWFWSATTVLLIISGVIGSAICYLALALQREIHATSFMVLQNAVRMAGVVAGIVIFFDPIGWPFQVHGLFASLLGALWYAWSQIYASTAVRKAAPGHNVALKDSAAALFVAAPREEMPSARHVF